RASRAGARRIRRSRRSPRARRLRRRATPPRCGSRQRRVLPQSVLQPPRRRRSLIGGDRGRADRGELPRTAQEAEPEQRSAGGGQRAEDDVGALHAAILRSLLAKRLEVKCQRLTQGARGALALGGHRRAAKSWLSTPR